MLALNRSVDDVIVIDASQCKQGELIEIMVLSISDPNRPGRQSVKLGIAAPRHVTVDRKEVWQQIKRQGGRRGS